MKFAADEIGLYSFRWSVGRGWTWRLERTCLVSTSAHWLDTFQRDEPKVTFKLARSLPRASRSIY